MQAQYKRKLRSGTEYNHYFNFSQLKRTDPVLLNRGDVFDTIIEMARIVKDTLPDTAKIAPVLRGANLKQTCANIFDFVYSHMQYTLDKEGVEQLRRPLRAWADRAAGVDCDCYSIFISSILMNLGIDHYFRMTKYKGDWQHIYIVVPHAPGKAPKAGNYYTIDCVVDKFDYEVAYSDKHDKKMSSLQYLNGLPTFGNVAPAPGFGAEFIGFGKGALSGLGSVPTAEALYLDMLDRMRLHFENTLAQLKANPGAVPDGGKYKGQLENLLTVWQDAAKRTLLLDQYAAEEDTLGNFWDKVKKPFKAAATGIKNAAGWVGDKVGDAAQVVGTGVKNAANWTKDTVVNAADWVGDKAGDAWTGITNAADWVGDIAGDAWEGVKNAAEWTFDKVIQLNPLSVLMRNGLLLAFKINLLRMAERLGYGYWTEQEAVSKGLNLEEFRKAKAKLEDVQKLWRGLRGDEDSLKKNILQGWEHGVKKRDGVQGLGAAPRRRLRKQLGEAATATATAAATPIIVKIIDWLKSIDWVKLFSGVKNMLDRPLNTDYTGSNFVPDNFRLPESEEEYYANAAPNVPPKSEDNTMLYLGLGVAGILVYGLMQSE